MRWGPTSHLGSTHTLCPFVRLMYMVVLRPYGTAMIAKERPRMWIMLSRRGSSAL